MTTSRRLVNGKRQGTPPSCWPTRARPSLCDTCQRPRPSNRANSNKRVTTESLYKLSFIYALLCIESEYLCISRPRAGAAWAHGRCLRRGSSEEKIFLKNRKKMLDKSARMWYYNTRKREESPVTERRPQAERRKGCS